MTIKDEVIQTISNFPDNVDFDHIMGVLMYKHEIEQGLQELNEGEIIDSNLLSVYNPNLKNYTWTKSAYNAVSSISHLGEGIIDIMENNISEALKDLPHLLSEEKIIFDLGIQDADICLIHFSFTTSANNITSHSLVLKRNKEKINFIAILDNIKDFLEIN
jgi:hypothetical protein